jgi:predicted nicotinamide N-methyase
MSTASAVTSAERAALLARIHRRHTTVTRPLQVGPLLIDFTRVANPNEVFVHMEQETAVSGDADPRWQPYWAEAWESAFAIARLLSEEELTDRQVLDLGCGLGLPGTVAAAKGAQVLLADAAQPALLFARLNTWPWADRARVRRLDWRQDRLPGERFDVIVGADILYQREDWTYLEPFWRAHLAPQGRLLLGEPGRRISAGFSEWLAAKGWQISCRPLAETVRTKHIQLITATLA